MPNNSIALQLIKASNTPLVAPSANTSGKPSPTKAQHVYEDLQGKVDIILDGGATQIGLESTVLDLTSKPYTILRPGKITKQEIEKILNQEVQNVKKRFLKINQKHLE